jgi:NADH:ubiquinone oxidoreductase subunit E
MAEAPPRAPGVEARAGKFPGPSLIPALNAIQERVGWLPREELVALSRDVRRPLYEIEGLISFYPHFRTDPPVKAELRVCHDLSCWLRGADERIAAIKERYGSDADVEVVEGSCLGRCDIAPACTVNEAPFPLTAAAAAVAAARRGGPGGNGGAGSPPVRGGIPGVARGDGDIRTTRTLRLRDRYAVPATCAGRAARRGEHHRRSQGHRTARHGRRRLPHGPQMGPGRGPGNHAEVRDLQRR